MEYGFLMLFMLISLICIVGSAVLSICSGRIRILKRNYSALTVFTAGLFLSVLIFLMPVYFWFYDYGGGREFSRPLWLALQNTIRVFILDGNYELVVTAAKTLPMSESVCFTLYGAVLFIAAPITTFGNVIAVFSGFTGEMRFRRIKRRPIFIMSKLNERSIIMAKSICNAQKDKKPVIVFTEVFPKDEEESFELVSEAKSLKAICLKTDITRLDLRKKRGVIEIYLCDEDEWENVEQAGKIIEELENRRSEQNIKLFVCARSEASLCVLNSTDYTGLLDYSVQHGCEQGFKLRRIDSIRQQVWAEVPEMSVFENIRDGVISVLLVGIGSFGREFFKMLSWYCQADGIRLEINIVDKLGHKGGREIEAILERSCPELIQTGTGDGNYSVRCFSGIDIDTSDLAELFMKDSETANRLKRTTLAVVALGNDDRNIGAAVYLRELFDRAGMIKAGKSISAEEELPQIYAVVTDAKKSACGFIGHAGIPYHINCICGTEDRYSRKNLYNAEMEQEAYSQHIGWAELNRKISEELKENGVTDEEIKNLGFWYEYDNDTEKKKYEKFEYFRLSSIARMIHYKALKKNFPEKTECTGDGRMLCRCESCEFLKKSEHLRWMAYMRANGYVYNDVRADRARLHNNLVPWEDLTEYERAKDKII